MVRAGTLLSKVLSGAAFVDFNLLSSNWPFDLDALLLNFFPDLSKMLMPCVGTAHVPETYPRRNFHEKTLFPKLHGQFWHWLHFFSESSPSSSSFLVLKFKWIEVTYHFLLHFFHLFIHSWLFSRLSILSPMVCRQPKISSLVIFCVSSFSWLPLSLDGVDLLMLEPLVDIFSSLKWLVGPPSSTKILMEEIYYNNTKCEDILNDDVCCYMIDPKILKIIYVIFWKYYILIEIIYVYYKISIK